MGLHQASITQQCVTCDSKYVPQFPSLIQGKSFLGIFREQVVRMYLVGVRIFREQFSIIDINSKDKSNSGEMWMKRNYTNNLFLIPVYFFFVSSNSRPMGLNVLGYQSHLLQQPCQPRFSPTTFYRDECSALIHIVNQ